MPGSQNERALWWALGLTGSFLVAEVVAGLILNSLALLADAAHMFTDAAALAIALAAIRIARRPADGRRTYGYHRFEILAAAFNALLLFGVAIYILIEAYQRFRSPAEVHAMGMLWVAAFGLVINLISMRMLSSGKDASLNLKGAYLEVWSDMLGSVGVIVGALVIKYTDWLWVDSLIAVAIGLWVLPRTWALLKERLNILLEGVPDGIDVQEVEKAICEVTGVSSVHDLHIWSLTSGKSSLTAHVVHEPERGSATALLRRCRRCWPCGGLPCLAQTKTVRRATVPTNDARHQAGAKRANRAFARRSTPTTNLKFACVSLQRRHPVREHDEWA